MSHSTSGLAPVKYETELIRLFTIMTVVWGIVGMGIGVFIASQLAWPALNFDIEWISFGRLRPLHTNAVIFAFGGCGLIGTSYYVVQRTCQVRLFSDKLASRTGRRRRAQAGRGQRRRHPLLQHHLRRRR